MNITIMQALSTLARSITTSLRVSSPAMFKEEVRMLELQELKIPQEQKQSKAS
jgi:hypothetical protein